MSIVLNGTTGVTTPDVTSDGSLKIDASAPDDSLVVDASGNVGIGTSSIASGTKMQIQSTGGTVLSIKDTTSGSGDYSNIWFGDEDSEFVGFLGYNHGSDAMTFGTSASERARITSDGKLMVGVASSINGNTSYNFQNNSAALNTAWFQNSSTSTGTSVLVATAARAASSGFNFIDCGANFPTSFARQFLVRGDGVVYAQNTSIQSLSDVRVKENIVDATDGLEKVLALRPVRFDFKEGFGNDRKNVLGFIAQEVETVFPDAVDVSPVDPDGEGPEEPYKSVGPSALIPVLVKAIQEQQAIIEALTARVSALEAANV